MELAKSDGMAARWEGFTNLPALRQMGLLFGLAASIALGGAIVLWAQQPSYGVLYGSLGNKEATEIMDILQQKKIDYKVDENTGALMVPSSKVHEVRIALAGEGLPRSSNQGVEFLQNKQEFGTSQFIQTTRYQHALETELARSIMTISNVESARVHLAIPKQSVFVRDRRKPSASVVVNLYSGRTLEEGQVMAITNLVASSIPEMEPGQVAVVDERGRLLSRDPASPEMMVNQDQFEYSRKIEHNYVQRIEDILAPFVGLQGVRAQVNADMDFTITERTEETYNPDLPALRSEQTSEERSYSAGAEGVPGALSNQPPANASAPEQLAGAGGSANGATPQRSRKSSTVNYELDRAISHTKMSSGTVSRLSIAVVVDDKQVVTQSGELGEDGQPLPPTVIREAWSEEELGRMTALVKEAVGYNARRGDTVNVINASFNTPQVETVPAKPVWEESWVQDYSKIAIGIIVILALIFGVLRPVLRNLATVTEPQRLPAAAGGDSDELGDDRVSLSHDKGETVKLPGPGAYEENIGMVRNVTREDPKLVAQVVKTWVGNE